MKEGIIKKLDLSKLLDSLTQTAGVFAPIRDDRGVALAEWTPGARLDLDYSNVDMPPKAFFLPQCQTLCCFEGDQLTDAPIPEEPRVIFGVRPCDAKALVYLDMVFGASSKFHDPYYMALRENALVIARACADLADTCFCSSVGGSPTGRDGCDILAFDLDDAFLFDACSPKGNVFMKDHAGSFALPREADLKGRDARTAALAAHPPAVNVSGLKDVLAKGFGAPFWDALFLRCLGCGVCTYLCPTCHCFDITDETDDGQGRRIRAWDSCQYPLFTLHASGHNPRPARKERMRQRIMHKFLYAPENFGETFCVGCGRCVRKCPVNLDLREALETISALPV